MTSSTQKHKVPPKVSRLSPEWQHVARFGMNGTIRMPQAKAAAAAAAQQQQQRDGGGAAAAQKLSLTGPPLPVSSQALPTTFKGSLLK